jgi:hypothetical protein
LRDKIFAVADQLGIGRQLLRQLAGLLSDGDVTSWAQGVLQEIAREGPTFGSDEESMADVLKRCSLAGQRGFGLSGEDLRRLMRRVALLQGPVPPFPEKGRFLACRRMGKYVPIGSGFVSSCQRCASPVVLPASRLSKLRECDGALLCWRCAQTFPGRIVEIGSA